MSIKGIIAIALIGVATSVSAQSTLSLDDFDLSPTATSPGTSANTSLDLNPETTPASEMEACLLDQSSCANAEYKTTDSISLDDVVNLGIVDHEEVQPEPVLSSSTTTGNANSSSVAVSQPKPQTQSLPTIDIEILFDSGKDDVRYDQETKLRELAGILASDQFSDYRFLFLGHTDAKGNEDFNWTLSQRRAESVARVVRIYTGLPSERVLASGMGESRLKDPNFPLAGINRRVQLVLLPR
ncbi:OmpA family protein [Shimia sediminis]|uniref:OmpA family protein n=1 Tax=Shimia sediminis TaxID=2497945 RepID=UPI000F8E3425|nr:OmpA family protein [Shimia sediminis]